MMLKITGVACATPRRDRPAKPKVETLVQKLAKLR